MKDVPSIRQFAEQLHGEIFDMRQGLELGPIEEPMSKDRLRPILESKLRGLGISPTNAQLDTLVNHFPIIDVDPDDAYPHAAEVFYREALALARLFERVVPELADLDDSE